MDPIVSKIFSNIPDALFYPQKIRSVTRRGGELEKGSIFMNNCQKWQFLYVYFFFYFFLVIFLWRPKLFHTIWSKNDWNRIKNEVSGFFLIKFPDLQKIIINPIKNYFFCKSNKCTKKIPESSFFIRFPIFLTKLCGRALALIKKKNLIFNPFLAVSIHIFMFWVVILRLPRR